MTVDFTLDGQPYTGLNGGPQFQFNESVSFQIMCKDQEEADHYWTRLTEGGEESQCGWLKDKFGVSWQVVPTELLSLLSDPDPAAPSGPPRRCCRCAGSTSPRSSGPPTACPSEAGAAGGPASAGDAGPPPLGFPGCRRPPPRRPPSSCPSGALPSGRRWTRWSARGRRCASSTSAGAAGCSPSRSPASATTSPSSTPVPMRSPPCAAARTPPGSATASAASRATATSCTRCCPRRRTAGGGFDLALCHWVLEVVDDPAVTLSEIARALRPGGQVSLAATNRAGAVLARAVSGHPVEALALHEGRDPAPSRGRPRPPLHPGRPARPGRGRRTRGRAPGGASPSSRTCSTRTPAPRPTPSAPWNWPWPRPLPTATSPPACTSWPPGRDRRRRAAAGSRAPPLRRGDAGRRPARRRDGPRRAAGARRLSPPTPSA